MDTWVWIVIVLGALVLLGVVLATTVRTRGTAALKERFGPEYDRAVEEAGSRRRAEDELREREERHSQLDLRPLEPDARERYQAMWSELQSRFVERPQVTVADADSLVGEVMRERGYPVGSFASNAELLSV